MAKSKSVKSSAAAKVKSTIPRKSAIVAKAKGVGKGRAMSLHIGMNAVDKNCKFYKNKWILPPLGACLRDAESMKMLATSRGMVPCVLTNKAATRDAVILEIQKAASSLNTGDLFFLTYSGHGGQLPDKNGDEDDRKDETWCLFDGMLLDDDLFASLSQFKQGVRIIMLSDSCHSGTMLDVHSANMPSATVSVAASVILISGCKDSQESKDGDKNGAFTAALLSVWNEGKFAGSYQALHTAIVRKMADAEQQSEYVFVGKANKAFQSQPVFTV